MENIENLIGHDFEGWPIYKKSLREILNEIGFVETKGCEKVTFTLKDESILDKFPVVMEDDGMGYMVNEKFIDDAWINREGTLIISAQPYDKESIKDLIKNYNREVETLDGYKTIAKYVHGSFNSLDEDVMYVFDKMPSLDECKKFCSNKTENRNIIVIKDGIVTECYKGTPDECNNSLEHTYYYHKQSYDLLVEKRVQRNVPLKAIRAVRGILSHLSKTQYRAEIKKALKSQSWEERIDVLRSINLNEIDFDSCQNNMSGLDIKKYIAFQCVQTCSLINRIEIYTKNEVNLFYPELIPFMQRDKDSSVYILQGILTNFIDQVEGLSNEIEKYDLLKEKLK